MDLKAKPIVKYNLNGKNYYITLKNNQSLYCAYYENDQLNDKLTNDELALALQIYSSLLVQKESSIKVSHAVVNNHNYDIYYDTKSANYFWNNYSSEDNSILNFIYNNQPEFLYFLVDDKKKKNTIQNYSRYKKLYVAGALTVILGILSIVNPTELPGFDTIDTINAIPIASIEQPDSNRVSSAGEKTPYDWNRIQSAIYENKNLSQSEKDLLLNLKFVFDADHNYMDLDIIEERLRELKIYYHDNSSNMYGVGGTYNGKKIDLYHCAHSVKQHNLIHELNHVFQTGIGHHPFSEASNEIWARGEQEILEDYGSIENESSFSEGDKYFRILGTGYNDLIPIYYLVTKFMSRDEIIEYQYTKNLEIIANALSKYCSLGEAYELLTYIKTSYMENDPSEWRDSRKKILEQLAVCYKRATGVSPYADLEFALILYMDNSGIEVPQFEKYLMLMQQQVGWDPTQNTIGKDSAYIMFPNPFTKRELQVWIQSVETGCTFKLKPPKEQKSYEQFCKSGTPNDKEMNL